MPSSYRTKTEKNKTLTGADTYYSTVLDHRVIGSDNVSMTLDINSITGTGVSIEAIPQFAYEEEGEKEWRDDTDASFTITTVSSQTVKMTQTGLFSRLKLVVTGTNPVVNYDLYQRASIGGSGGASTGGGIGGTVDQGAAGLTSWKTVEDNSADILVAIESVDNKLLSDPILGLKVQDTLIPQAYDNTLGVIKSVNAPLADGTYAWTSDSSNSLEASSIVKASSGVLRLFSGYIDSTAPTGTYYLQFFNSSSVPADGIAIAANFIAPAIFKHTNGTSTTINLDFTQNGKAFSAGLIWCLSSTVFTKTITGAYISATVLYK